MTANAETYRNSLPLTRTAGTRPNLALLSKLALAGAALAATWLARQPLAELLALIKDRDALVALVQGLGVWGPLALGFTIAFQVTFAVLPGHVLMLAGGYLYGFVPGMLITWVSTVAASQFNFWLARRYGWPLVYRMAPRALVDRWAGTVRDKGFIFYLLTLVLPIFPSDLMCYLAGFSRLTPRRYAVVNMLGHLPCAIGMSLVGSGLLVLPPMGWVWALGLCAVALVLWRRYGSALENRFFPVVAQEAKMSPQFTSNAIVLLGLAVSLGLGGLQWWMLRRLFRRLNDWVAVSIVAAALSAPLTVGVLTDALVQAGVPAARVLPLGLGLLLALMLAGLVWVGVTVWVMARLSRPARPGAGQAE